MTTTKPVILIADDHDVNRRLIDRILMPHGYSMLHAANGKEAVEIAIAQSPDLVLMDIRMPVMDGLEALRLLRHDGRTRTIPVLALTAYSTQEQLGPIAAAGFNAVITKPIDIDALLKLVQSHLRNSR